MEEVTAKLIDESPSRRFEILVPQEDTGIFDKDGNPISGSRKEIADPVDLQRQKDYHLTEVDKLNAKLKAIENVKSTKGEDDGTAASTAKSL